MSNPLFYWLHEWWCKKHHHHPHPHSGARAITNLALTRVDLTLQPNTGLLVMNVTLAFDAPATRKDGTPLNPQTDIDHFSLTRNGVEIQTLAPPATGTAVTATDLTPLTGSDDYEVFTITTDTFISPASNDAIITVAEANPAVAIVNLTATLNP